MGFFDDVIGGVSNAVGDVANDVEGVAGGAVKTAEGLLGGPAGNLIGTLLAGLGTGGTSLFAELPQLSQMLGGLSGLTGMLNPAQQFSSGSLQTTPYPFSQAASGIPTSFFSNPTQLNSSLSSASSKLLSGVGSGPLGSFDAGAIDSKVNSLQNQAAQDAANGNTTQAQQEMTEAATLQQMASQILSILGNELKDSIQNWKVQG